MLAISEIRLLNQFTLLNIILFLVPWNMSSLLSATCTGVLVNIYQLLLRDSRKGKYFRFCGPPWRCSSGGGVPSCLDIFVHFSWKLKQFQHILKC